MCNNISRNAKDATLLSQASYYYRICNRWPLLSLSDQEQVFISQTAGSQVKAFEVEKYIYEAVWVLLFNLLIFRKPRHGLRASHRLQTNVLCCYFKTVETFWPVIFQWLPMFKNKKIILKYIQDFLILIDSMNTSPCWEGTCCKGGEVEPDRQRPMFNFFINISWYGEESELTVYNFTRHLWNPWMCFISAGASSKNYLLWVLRGPWKYVGQKSWSMDSNRSSFFWPHSDSALSSSSNDSWLTKQVKNWCRPSHYCCGG